MRIEEVEGDIADQPDVDAIVNAWNRNVIPWWLLLPQGVSGAIKRRAGRQPFWELGYRPLPLGKARLTSAGNLPNKAIIHVAGINLLWTASEASIRMSTESAVALAITTGFGSLAMPVIGAGSGRFNQKTAAAIILETVHQMAPQSHVPRHFLVRIVHWRGARGNENRRGARSG